MMRSVHQSHTFSMCTELYLKYDKYLSKDDQLRGNQSNGTNATTYASFHSFPLKSRSFFSSPDRSDNPFLFQLHCLYSCYNSLLSLSLSSFFFLPLFPILFCFVFFTFTVSLFSPLCLSLLHLQFSSLSCNKYNYLLDYHFFHSTFYVKFTNFRLTSSFSILFLMGDNSSKKYFKKI